MAQAYLSVSDVAKRFGVTMSTVYRLVQQGKLPGFKIGGQWRFREDVLDSWVLDQITLERFRANEQSS